MLDSGSLRRQDSRDGGHGRHWVAQLQPTTGHRGDAIDGPTSPCLAGNLQEPHGHPQPPAAMMDSARHCSIPSIDIASGKHAQRRHCTLSGGPLVLRVITVLGKILTPSPLTVGQEGLREGPREDPGRPGGSGPCAWDTIHLSPSFKHPTGPANNWLE